ncbi:MAG: M28 family metallopeptidase [Nitriliruptorales bacterium]|nr:M28 family metallopeptidase [Nitriliruptorales bacterium]
MRGQFDADRAIAFAAELAAAGPRPAGSEADAAARRKLQEALGAAGWDVRGEPFALPQGGESANVVATIGRSRDRPQVVIGAHLDTVADSPGANDNASGVGVLVALAEELADETGDLPVAVVLVGFGAEELQPSTPRQHHIGSEAMAAATSRVMAMLSIDMVGNGDILCVCWYPQGPDLLAQRLHDLAHEHEIPGVQVRAEGDVSDHGPFARRGVPAAFLWTGIDGRYHSPADTAEHLRVGDLDRAGRLALAFVRSLADDDQDGLEAGS